MDPPNTFGAFLRNPVTWILMVPLATALLVVVVLVLKGRADNSPKLPVHRDAPTFTLEDQSARSFKSESLRGRVWIANFIFTRCEVVCPLTTAKMVKIQRQLGPSSGTQLVSFSVDPQYDTPQRLSAYAKKFKANELNWRFLRSTRRMMKQVVFDGFKIGMGIIGIKDDAEADTANVKQSDMVHGEHFVLVDKQMRIRGYYALEGEDSIARIVRHARFLAK